MHSGRVRFHDDLDSLMVPIDDVRPHPDNYNNGDVDLIIESIRANGMYRPVYVDRETNEIVAGNHTWLACKELGATVIPIIRVDGDSLNQLRVMIADNVTARRAQPDLGLLLPLLERLNGEEALLGSGYDDDSLNMLRQLAEIEAENLDFASWPTLTLQVPPHIRRAFYDLTSEAGSDHERLELLLRLAGWRP